MLDNQTIEALVEAESAMFHVLADMGFNSKADIEAMQQALEKVRAIIKQTKVAA